MAPLIAMRGSMVVMVRRKEDGMVTGPGMRDILWLIVIVLVLWLILFLFWGVGEEDDEKAEGWK